MVRISAGANPDELDQLAGIFTSKADQIAAIQQVLNPQINTSPWHGRNADRFRHQWSNEHRQAMAAAVRFLRDGAQSLHQNAGEQRDISRDPGGLPLSGRHWQQEERERLAKYEDWARVDGSATVMRLADASPEEQLAWWRSLNDEQRAAMLIFAPALLLSLSGLPQDVRDSANRNYTDARLADAEMYSETISASAEGNVKVLHVGLDSEATMSKMGDGHYEVKLKLDGEVGVALKAKLTEAGMGVRAGEELTYTFETKAEARAFLDGLQKELIPNGGEIGQSLLPIVGGGVGFLVADAGRDGAAYLDRFSNRLKSAKASAEVYTEAEVSAAGAKAGVRGATGMSRDSVSGEKTLYAEFKADSSAGLGYKAGGSVDVTAAVAVDSHNRLDHMSLEFEIESESGVDVEAALSGMGSASVASGSGRAVAVSATLDLRNPVTADLARSYLDKVAAHDPSASADLNRLLRSADVTAQVKATTHTSGALDALVVKAEVGKTTSQAVATYVKPPNGAFRTLTS